MEHCGFGQNIDGEWVPKKIDGKDMMVKGVSYSVLYMKAFKKASITDDPNYIPGVPYNAPYYKVDLQNKRDLPIVRLSPSAIA